jgi:hypothetical protein
VPAERRQGADRLSYFSSKCFFSLTFSHSKA